MPDLAVEPHLLENLLTYCVDFAKLMLAKAGDFHPFGATILPDGTLTAAGGHAGERAGGREVFLLLQDAFKAQFQRQEIVAAAIAANVDIPADYRPTYPDGIRVLIECAGYSRFFYLPYRLEKPSLAGRLVGRRPHCAYAEFISVAIDPILCTGATS